MINKAVSFHNSQMKNTLIVIAEQAVKNYRTNHMERLYCDMNDLSLDEFASDLIQLGKDMNALLTPHVSLAKFRDEFRVGSTMLMLEHKEFEQLEVWDKNKEEFQIAIFREDGTAVGIIDQAHINW